MAIKDKLVTLEDLKAAYDDLVEKMGAWEDITSSLTWVDDAALKPIISSDTKKYLSISAKKATLAVSPGDRLRITAYCPADLSGYNEDNTTYFTARAQAAIVYGGNNFKLSPEPAFSSSNSSVNGYGSLVGTTYKEFIVRIPKSGVSSIDIYDYDTNHGIIVEKQVTT